MVKAATYILAQMEKPLQDEITTSSGIKFYLDPSYRPEWNASCTATVVAKPNRVSNINEGDNIAFSFRVASDVKFAERGENYLQITEDNPYLKKFTNSKGNNITVVAIGMPTGFTKWIGLCLDRQGNRIDGVEGRQSDVERWLSQFSFGEGQGFTFNRLFEHDGEDYWRIKPEELIAKKNGDKITSLCEKVICEPIHMDLSQRVALKNGLHIPDKSIQGLLLDRAKVVAGGEEKGLREGQIVSFLPEFSEKYTMFGKEFILIKQSRVNGVWE